ncbi:MAG TPA: tetratricopeptide repeat protein [Candidatus Krumholzibacteria bacterium]|nr:tetratricopeptide repeat protein [Candidatus Krumholzibacteria bacterium]
MRINPLIPVIAGVLLAGACARDRGADEAARAVSDPLAANATHVGTQVCAGCHQEAWQAWKGSHHDFAMDEATAETVLGDFNDATYAYFGVTSRFFRRDGKFFVRTDGADGKLRDFQVAYVFGFHPLQQYLVEFPDGRHQALTLAWDARAREAGGQRWFHLQPDEPIRAGDELHWTGPALNWNYMCAECHSTRLRKRYDGASRTWASDWSEIDVACEACHGAGSAHVDWAGRKKRGENVERYSALGLQVRLRDPAGGTWSFPPGAATAVRSAPWRADAELETCGRCHARRTQVRDEYVHGRPLMDTHLPVVLEEGLYHADGQILDEVYEYASFRQSRMYHQGVACHDCHEPHTLKLRTPGDLVCGQCHATSAYATPAHHFHRRENSAGASCIACHMPRHDYMVVDPRFDHSMRVPRPDVSARIGTPNACTMACHADKPVAWAADSAAVWWPKLASRPQYGEALHAGRVGAPRADAGLVALVSDPESPAVVRATALTLLGAYRSQETLAALRAAAVDPDPLVRHAAAGVAEGFGAAHRVEIALSLARDPVRTVRAEAARVLAPALGSLSGDDRRAVDAALADYVAMQEANADRAFAHLNLGNLRAALGDRAAAAREYRTAIELESRFVPAYVNLADLYRAENRDSDGLAVLQQGVEAYPDAPELHRSLALVYTRQQRPREALASIARAAGLRPEDAGLAYVHALALHGAGRVGEAIAVLERALEHEPYHRDVLFALATFQRDRGDARAAVRYARRLAELEPRDATVQALLAELVALER